jgi:hypothetical protein
MAPVCRRSGAHHLRKSGVRQEAVLEETQDEQEIIERVSALDFG